jgi:hypothetical protein
MFLSHHTKIQEVDWSFKFCGKNLTKYTENYQVKEDEIGRACSTLWEKRMAYRVLVGEPDGRRPPGKPRLCGR